MIKAGDLVLSGGKTAVVVKVVDSRVFEGGEQNQLVTILLEERLTEVMSWQVKKVS